MKIFSTGYASGFLFLLSLLSLPLSAGVKKDGDYSLSVVEMGDGSKEISLNLREYRVEKLFHNGKNFSRVILNGSSHTSRKGFPELPIVNATLSIAPEKAYRVEIISSDFKDEQVTYPVVPSRGVVFRNQNPEEIPYVIARESRTDTFFPKKQFRKGKPFVFRDRRGINIYLNPFRYNSEKKILRVYRSIKLRLVESVGVPVNPLKIKRKGKINREMEKIYGSLFLNYRKIGLRGGLEKMRPEFGDILVLLTERDKDAIKPYVEWKRIKGFNVIEKIVDKGTNVKDIVADEYKKNSNLLYVLLVGDWDDIKSDTEKFLGVRSYEDAPMDPILGCVDGDDLYPELIVGRFSANSAEEVAIQVKKSVEYEKNPNLNGEWYRRGVAISSGEGVTQGDDREDDTYHLNVISENKLLKSTYSEVAEIAGGPYKKPKPEEMTGALNRGAGIVNYVGHGDEKSFVTTGFDGERIDDLENGSMQPFIIAVACLNGRFHKTTDDMGEEYGDCFAERWLKKENGGAIATLMSTVLQPWAPPMAAQDYMNDLLTGGYDYENNPGYGTSTTEGRKTFGSIVVNGEILMLSENETDENSLITIKTWTIFGDPSLEVRTDTPHEIEVAEINFDQNGTFMAKIKSEGPTDGISVSISRDGQIFHSLTDRDGAVSIEHTFTEGNVLLTVTGSNIATHQEKVSVGGSEENVDSDTDEENVDTDVMGDDKNSSEKKSSSGCALLLI